MIEGIQKVVKQRGIRRLSHFTPSRNLVHIITDPHGVLSTKNLRENERAVFNPTDIARLDGLPDHICCSIQYPNGWYFKKAREKERLFSDWVVLLIHPRHLWESGTKFCARNAAAKSGQGVGEGIKAFEAMFAPKVTGAYGKTYDRGPSHPSWWPTDDQAEILIPDKVEREDLIGMAVLDESQAKREAARIEQLRAPALKIIIAPDFFDAKRLSNKIRSGQIPKEREFKPGEIYGRE